MKLLTVMFRNFFKTYENLKYIDDIFSTLQKASFTTVYIPLDHLI
jgi:hypothetical protein